MLASHIVTLPSPTLVTSLSLYPYSSFTGTFRVSAALHTPLLYIRNDSTPEVYLTGRLLAQTAVHTLVDASYPD